MPLLTYLKASHHVWERGQETFGDGRNTALARLVVIGHLEHRPYDHSALAASTRLSRTQVMRRCLRLEQAGWLVNKRDANHVLVLPTEALVEYWQEQVTVTSPILGRWVKLASMLGIVAYHGVTVEEEHGH